MNSSLVGIINAFQSLKETEKEFVLVTIIETQGSTYRKAGARMLIARTGQYCGLLGGGCFESDLLAHADKVFDTRQPLELYYDMRGPEDLVWGLGLGCNGAVRLWLEHLSQENDFSPLSLFETALQTKSPCVMITICEPDTGGESRHFLFADSNNLPVELNPPPEFTEPAMQTLDTGNPVLHKIETANRSVQAFFARVSPPVQLLIVGGGPDAVPVVRLAKLLGWEVTIVDFREAYSKPEKFPEADHVICATPEQLQDKIRTDIVNAAVLMTHKYEYDLRYLRQLVHPSIRYLGLLGPTARRNELLRAAGIEITASLKDRVYGPVGLNIGGELPEEIALSLIAGIQSVLNNRNGGHLSDIRPAGADLSATSRLGCIILAAGGSTRFGALKQLLEFKGKSLLGRVVGMACKLMDKRVTVVHGPKATKCQREISDYDVVNIVNDEWESGLSSSLALAVKSLPADFTAIMILLCDQPLIERHHLEQLINTWREHQDKIIASSYSGTHGVPAIIPKQYFPDMLRLGGDEGAKTILNRHADNLLEVPLPEAEFDIDTQEDFARLLRRKPA